MNGIDSITISIEEFLKKGVSDKTYKIKINKKTEKIVLPKDRQYVIPEYQREIRWRQKNVASLISDLKSSTKFLGTVLLSTVDEKKFDIIDGQQRITVILLLLNYITNVRKVSKFEACDFVNETYKYMFEISKYNFILGEEIDAELLKKYKTSDLLEQTPKFKEIWTTIDNLLKKEDAESLGKLKGNILGSPINLIINKELSETEASKQKCIYHYLDINDKSVPLDTIDILKAYLFKDNFELWMSNWIAIQNKIGYLRYKNVEYDVLNIFYQYFLCCVNEELNWTLTGLTKKFITKNSNNINPKYGSRKHITEIVKDSAFYEKMGEKLKEYLDFIKKVVDSQNINSEFDKYFLLEDGKSVSDVKKKCIYFMIKAILGINDQVPKMLIMKYFLEVLNNKEAKDSDYDYIYDIYYCSISFAISDEKKNSDVFSKIVLTRDWKTELLKKVNNYKKQAELANYCRKVIRRGYSNETAGQELPRHIFAIREYWGEKKGKYRPLDPKKVEIYLSARVKNSMEHFMLNQQGWMKFKYGSSNKEGKYTYPTSIFNKMVSWPINYLVLDEEINSDIGNVSVLDKIRQLEENPKMEDSKWGNATVKKVYDAIKEFFNNIDYPDDFSSIEDEEEVKELFDKYFISSFEDDLKKLEKIIKLVYS